MIKKVCGTCSSKNLESRFTTWPVSMGEKQLNIGRVSVRVCLDCQAMVPTKAGKEKIGRSMMAFMMMISEKNHSSSV
jgi:hypothetical protein